MGYKFLSLLVIIVLFVSILFITEVNAESINFFCSKKQNLTVILKNEADIDTSKDIISNIPQVKIINIKYRDKEWSKMVNKMDLPNIENPFKNEFIIKTNRKTDISEICKKIKELDFVEDVKYVSQNE